MTLREGARTLGDRIAAEVRPDGRLIAVLAVAGAVWAVWVSGQGWATPAFVVGAVAWAALAVIDVREQRLPDAILLPTTVACAVLLAVAAATTGAWGSLARAVTGAAALGGAYLVLSLVNPRSLGLGDVKLAMLIGMLTGWVSWEAVARASVLPFLLGGLVAAWLLIGRRARRQTTFAFGPLMILGAVIATTWGR